MESATGTSVEVTEARSVIGKIAGEIIEDCHLHRRHVSDTDELIEHTVYDRLLRYVTPRVRMMSPQGQLKLALAGAGLNGPNSFAPQRVQTRTTMQEVHGCAENWLPGDLDGPSLVFIMACSALIAEMFDQLGGERRAITSRPHLRPVVS